MALRKQTFEVGQIYEDTEWGGEIYIREVDGDSVRFFSEAGNRRMTFSLSHANSNIERGSWVRKAKQRNANVETKTIEGYYGLELAEKIYEMTLDGWQEFHRTTKDSNYKITILMMKHS